jgi:predicted negative regulator of RcsB-dependent stress response
LITGRYIASTLLPDEIVFRNVFQPGQAATRELLQSCRTEVHRAVKTRLGTNLLPTDTHGETITTITRKANNQTGTWTLTGDIMIRFGSARAAISAYQQQRTKQHNKNTQAERLLTYNS